MTLLTLQGLRKQFGATRALDDVSLSVAPGSRTAIVGPSGSGKTTLLRIVAGFEAPDTGTVQLGDRMLANGPAIVPAHLRGIGYVPQDGALFPHLCVADNIGFGLARSESGRDARIDELMKMVALDPAMRQRRPHELSGGQQQRVALARALAQRPSLMLLDEPFSALDTGLRAATRKAVARVLSQAGVTTILVTHDQAEALSFADQVAVMRAGRLVQVGSPHDLYQRPIDAATASFMGDALVLRGQAADGWIDCALGRLRCDDSARSGLVEVMWRPEQLDVVVDSDRSWGAAPPDVQDDAAMAALSAIGCAAIVVETDFGGSDCELTVQLAAGPSPGTLLTLRAGARTVPPVGSRVFVRARSPGHVLSGRD